MRWLLVGPALALIACVDPEPAREGVVEQAALTAAQRKVRLELIRDSAAELGVHNAALLGGIAVSETGLAHCWSEATWACQGPDSSSCNDGPVIAGAADGPCAQMQGGLGMFQFDAGTYTQTLSTYGPSILTVEGNTAQSVAFVVERLRQEIDGVDDWIAAVEHMNGVPMTASDPEAVAWGQFLACRYNGCCSTSTTCTTRAAGYRDNAIDLFNEMGADFWRTDNRCAAIPADGLIEQRSACYLAGGDPRYWRREATGHGDASEWTGTTTGAAASNFARWLLRPVEPFRAKLEVFVQGGTATQATYRIAHGATIDTVTIDQTTADGFVVLGEFALEATGDEYVELADNTGTASQRLAFDALRVTNLDGGGLGSGSGGGSGEGEEGEEGGCATGGEHDGVLVVLVSIMVWRRRRR